jgi:hypothetical protein
MYRKNQGLFFLFVEGLLYFQATGIGAASIPAEGPSVGVPCRTCEGKIKINSV